MGRVHKEDCQCAICKTKRGDSYFSPETCKKKSDALRGKTLSPEICKKIGDSLRGKHQSPEICKKKGDALRNPSLETRKKIGDANRGEKNPNKRPEIRQKHQKSSKQLWQNSEYVAKQMLSRQVSQNKLEKLLQEFLERACSGFQFTGDGQKIIAGKCPDFVNEEEKLIIELFGDYWHSQEVTGIPNEQHEQERIKLFESQGYKTLIIWEHELKDPDQVIEKVKMFLNS
jgi:very-short-patch-repair endonuclease